MTGTRTTLCGRCGVLRWVEDWHEARPEMLAIVLGPCGHVIERSARLTWRVPSRPTRAGARVAAAQ